MRVAVVGAGWAGMAAAVALTQAGHHVTVMEAARTLGGRARALHTVDATGQSLVLDNGQHILIGAYTETLRLMRTVGVDVPSAMLRLPLTLTYADRSGLELPNLPPPWDALVGVARARGWSWTDKVALLRTCASWQLKGFRCDARWSVAQLCERLPQRLLQEFIEPLCVSALNTPAHEASAEVFLRVLRDSLFSGRGGSNLLLPRTDLGALFPDTAAQWLQAQGAALHTGQRVAGLARTADGWDVDGTHFDSVVLATHSTEAARLVQAAHGSLSQTEQGEAAEWIHVTQALRFTSIGTVYAQASATSLPNGSGHTEESRHTLNQAMLALRPGPEQPAQFVFDRGHLGGPAGLLAFVVSVSEQDRATLEDQVVRQAQEQLGLKTLRPLQTVVEKRATFACTPSLRRPGNRVLSGLWAAGDYTEGPYPATLEGAIRSGLHAAQQITGLRH